MLKKTITFEDYNGNQHTETYWFGIRKSELSRLNYKYNADLAGYVKGITDRKDYKALTDLFEEFIKLAYGKKSEDGMRFIKRQEDLDAFVDSPAYDALYMEFVNDPEKFLEFAKGVVPADVADAIAKAAKEKEAEERALPEA